MAQSMVENPFTGQILPVEFAGDNPTQEELDTLYEFLNQSNVQTNTPITKQEYIEKRKADDAKSFGQTASEFGEGVVEGAGEIVAQGGRAISETPMSALFDYEALGDIINVGARDFKRFASTLGGAVMDKVGGYSEEEEIEREYKRYLDNFNYNVKVRPAMLEDVEYKELTDFGANFVDPFMAFPVAKLGSLAARAPLVAAQKAATAGAIAARSKGLVNLAKFAKGTAKTVKALEKGVDIAGKVGAYPTEMAARAGAKVLRKGIKGTALGTGVALKGIGKIGAGVELVTSAPRRGVAAVASKLKNVGEGAPGAAALTGQVAGAIGGIPGFLELGIAEGIGVMARKLGKGGGQFLTALGTPATNKRFLYRLATDDNVSPQMRKAAMFAHRNFGTSLGDGAFNMLANGVSVGALNAALAGAAGEDARTVGQGFGAGAVAGGVLPMGQRGMKAGKLNVARDAKSIDQHMQNKLNTLQRESFKKLPKPAQLMLATLQESGPGAPKFLIIEPKTYLETLNKDRAEKGLELLDRAPAGHFDKSSRTIYVNEANLQKGAKVATEIAAHEVGHDYVHQALGNDPSMLQILLEAYKTTPEKGTAFYFQFESKPATSADVKAGLAKKVGQIIDGDPIGEPIYINKDGVQISIDYGRKQTGIDIGRNASKLAQEIGADQFAMMFTKDPNAFNNFHPSLRRHLLDASRKFLTRIGVAEPMTGNPLSNPISKVMLNNPSIRRLYENYGKARAIELDEKGNLVDKGVLIKPKEGQTGEDRFTELFGGQGLSLRDSKNLAVSNKTLIRQVKEMMKIYKDEPKDTWFVSRGKFLGKNLLPDLRTIFTRNDPFGNVANILDALQEAINLRFSIGFGYRSGTKGKYQNPFKLRDIAIYGWEVSGFGQGRPTLKVVGYNQAVVRANIQTLVEREYIKNPKDFMRQLEEQGQKALEDPEGRINPEGRKENELMTVAFGLEESAPKIDSPGLRDLLKSKAIKKSYVSFDVEALAGLSKGGDKAFAFNYDNIRDNYNPFRQGDQNLFLPIETFEGSPSSAFKRSTPSEREAKIRRFKNPVTLRKGGRLSGVADNDSQDPFFGYDKNGVMFTVQRKFIQPDDIVSSRDSDKTAKIVRRELREGTILVPEMTDKNFYMPALQDARALVEQQGRVAIGTEEVFFQKFLPKLLRKVGGQVKQSTRSIREGARRAVDDVLPFMRDNPQFTDYYNKDMNLTRKELDNVFGGITDDQFLFFRLALGLTSPNTQLPANVGEGVGAVDHFVKNGNLDAVKMGRSEKGNVVLKETPFSLGGPPRGTKARTLKIVDRLIKEKGSVQAAADFLTERVSRDELNKFNKEMGYAGDVAKFSDIQRIVELATGQGKEIPRMFIFGPKVGAYTLNAIGNHQYNTIDVWEARFIRSYFKGMFKDNTGLPANVDEHSFMARFTEFFKEEFERMTGDTLDPSALQATRWFFMIDTAKRLGYSKAATNETISGYTKRYISELGLDKGSGRQSDGTPNEGVSGSTQDEGRQFLPAGEPTNRVFRRPQQAVNRFMGQFGNDVNFMPSGVRNEIPAISEKLSEVTDIFLQGGVGFNYDRTWHINTLIRRLIQNVDPQTVNEKMRKKYPSKEENRDNYYKYLKLALADLAASLPDIKRRDLRKGANSAANSNPFQTIKESFPGGQKRKLKSILSELAAIIVKFQPESIKLLEEVSGIGRILKTELGVDISEKFTDEISAKGMNMSPDKYLKFLAGESDLIKALNNPEFRDVQKFADRVTVSSPIELPKNFKEQ